MVKLRQPLNFKRGIDRFEFFYLFPVFLVLPNVTDPYVFGGHYFHLSPLTKKSSFDIIKQKGIHFPSILIAEIGR